MSGFVFIWILMHINMMKCHIRMHQPPQELTLTNLLQPGNCILTIKMLMWCIRYVP